MSKTATQSNTTKPAPSKHAPPAGYGSKSEDVVGFCDLETQGPIHGIPRGAKLSDSKIEKDKTSMFVIFELIDPVKVSAKDGDQEVELQAVKGDMVGVWTKPGMKGIRFLAGCKVWIAFTGEKNIGKPSPMKLYDVRSPDKGGTLIPIIEDNRERSRAVKTFLDASMTKEELDKLPF